MTDSSISHAPARVTPMTPDAIDRAQKQSPSDSWPHNPPIFGFAIGGAVVLGVAVVTRIMRSLGLPKEVALTMLSAAGLVGAIAMVWFFVHLIRRRRRRNARGLRAGDPSARIRVFGPDSKVGPIADDVENVAFEPIVMRSVHGVEFGRESADGTLITKPSKRSGLRAKTSESPDHKVHPSTFWSIALGILIVVGVHFLTVQFSRKDPPNYFEVMAGVALGLCISSFVRPVYVRVAPGVLDVFMFGVLGSGTPRVERYDLRTARVTVDGDRRLVRIEDPTRAGARTVFLHVGRLLGGIKPRERAVLMAARSTHPTPPMPMDALE
jgi:hypothetical protein